MPIDPLHQAAQDGDLPTVSRLLEQDPALLNAPNQGYKYVRHDAPDAGSQGRARRGGKAAAGPWCGRVFGRHVGCTAAKHACMEGKVSTLALLLDADVSGDLRTGHGALLLPLAALRQSMECVQLLLARGADVDAITRTINYAALHHAAELNDPALVRVLLAAGADPRVRNIFGYRPLELNRDEHGDGAPCIPLLKAALAAPDLGRLFLRARAIVDTRQEAARAAQDAELPAPACLKGRLDVGQELPAVVWVKGADVGFRALVERLVGDEQQAAAIPHDLLACVVSFLMPKWWYKKA